MTDRGREFIGLEFTRLLKNWYQPPESLAPEEVQVHGGGALLVLGKVLEDFAIIHMPQLDNDNPFQPVPGFDPGHIIRTGKKEPNNPPPFFVSGFIPLSFTALECNESPFLYG
ncbi:hypothetical protein DSO57_1036829 [Entomophthora muscae]|uniref:Uncharacterized protein n=1 Tax=Entomophthora muscae TaxID=34485 RepID=A0ACC2RQ54_9FUNG|nr:hypothetical protein DSO57_1036829 [Entomophthora muscae]